MRLVNGCPCGEAHRMTPQNQQKLREAERRHGPTAPVGRIGACWRVPRIYLACHHWTAETLPGLARLYNWPEVK